MRRGRKSGAEHRHRPPHRTCPTTDCCLTSVRSMQDPVSRGHGAPGTLPHLHRGSSAALLLPLVPRSPGVEGGLGSAWQPLPRSLCWTCSCRRELGSCCGYPREHSVTWATACHQRPRSWAVGQAGHQLLGQGQALAPGGSSTPWRQTVGPQEVHSRTTGGAQ